jgi:hypothetical protein
VNAKWRYRLCAVVDVPERFAPQQGHHSHNAQTERDAGPSSFIKRSRKRIGSFTASRTAPPNPLHHAPALGSTLLMVGRQAQGSQYQNGCDVLRNAYHLDHPFHPVGRGEYASF